MSPMSDQRMAGAHSAVPAPMHMQGAAQVRTQVDYTDQASFSQEVDTSPYATQRSAKRAAVELGEVFSPARKAASVEELRSQMRVIEGGAVRPSVSKQAQRAQRAASRTKRAEQEFQIPRGPVMGSVPNVPPAPAAQARPSAAGSVARPQPGPAAQPGDVARAAAQAAYEGRVFPANPGVREEASKPSISERLMGLAGALGGSETLVRRVTVGVTFLACVTLTVVTLYSPAQQLYSAYRENERLTDELAQNQARVEALEKSVSSLQTAEGVQDAARKTWGLVMPDEVSLSVENAAYQAADTSIPDEVRRGSGKNTSTWVTDILDQVFGETGATTATESTEQTATVSETEDSSVDSATPELSDTQQ